MNKFDLRQSVVRNLLPCIGNSINEEADNVLGKIDDELAKLFEDRNVLLAGGGDITYNSNVASFTASLYLHINSRIIGGSPITVNLTSDPRTFTNDGDMFYVVVDRNSSTPTSLTIASTLPTVTSLNLEVFLIAKRIGTTLLFRDGTVILNSRTVKLGAPDLYGSLGSTNNVLLRADGTDGKTIKGTGIVADDSNNLSGIATLTATEVDTNTINEKTLNAGVTIDGNILKDNAIQKTSSIYVGTSVLDTSAILQADSTSKGFLPPRVTTAQRTAIVSPATGLLVFDTSLNSYYFNSGTPGAPVWTILSVGGSSRLKVFAQLNAGTYTNGFTTGVNVTELLLYGCGGGGGGGAGGAGGSGGSNQGGGGGGGAGATPFMMRIAVTQNTSYTYIVGAGGAGGTPTGVNGQGNGGTGGNTSFNSVVIGKGASGGYGGYSHGYTPYNAPGGRLNALANGGYGGDSISGNGANGDTSLSGASGGIAGAYGWGAGGGGGGGAFYNNTGGNGAIPDSNTGGAGSAYGAGGGGGGGGYFNIGGSGGVGGKGFLYIFWVE